MLKRILASLLLITLTTAVGLYVSPEFISLAHADSSLVGKVCVANQGDTICPITTPTITGPTSPGPNVRFSLSILVNGSDYLSNFDVTLRTNSTVLKPTNATSQGSVLTGTVREVLKCIGGVNIIGSSSCSSTDGPDTLHYVVSGGLQGSRPVTGLLFTAIYTVQSISPNTPIDFQTGCAGTSVAGGICVTISGGGTAVVPETSQSAKFSNTAYFDLVPNTGSLQVSQGDVDSTMSLLVTSLNGFGGTAGANVTLSGSSSPTGPIVPIVTVSPNVVLVTTSSAGLTGIIVNVTKTVPPGNYTLSITGTSGTLVPNTVTIQLLVPIPDFSLTPSPNVVTFNVTVLGTSNIVISSIGNYAANVTLSETASPGLKALFANNQKQIQLRLHAGTTNNTILSLNSTIPGSYSVNVTAYSGSFVHLSKITVFVVDYALHTNNPGVLTVVNGTTVPELIDVEASAVYNVTVTVGTIYVDQIRANGIDGPSRGVAVSCTPTIMNLTYIGNVNGHNQTNCAVTGQAVGNYVVTITATSGSADHTSNHALSFQVAVVRPGFSIVLPLTVTTVSVGSATTIKVAFVNNHGTVDNVTVGVSISDANLAPFFVLSSNSSIVTLKGTTKNATILVTIIASSTAPPGQYTLVVEGTGKFSDPTRVDGQMPFVVISTTSPEDLEVYSVTPSATSVTIGTDVTIAILVRNVGKLAENATVLAIVGDQDVGSKNVTLSPGQNVTVTITWHTSGYSSGAYMIGGKVPGVPGESILSNNLLRSATPVTLNAANTSVFSNPYTVPAIVVAALILVAAGLALFLLPRRKTQSA